MSTFFKNIDVRFYEEDWHVRVAKQIIKATKKYELECWRPERTINKVYARKKDGITYRIFPSFYLRFGMEYSISLIQHLAKESRKSDVLIHLHGIHNYLAHAVGRKFSNFPIIGQQHGSSPSLYKFHKSDHPLRFSFLLNHSSEKRALKGIDHFFVLTEYEKKALSELVPLNKIEIQTMGVDFDKFKPMNKESARELLRLRLDKKIMLYVGRFNEVKRVDLILDAFKKLRKKHSFELILIGGTKNDKFYEKAKFMGARVIERITSKKLVPYFNASDIYCTFYRNNLWGGIGIAPVESLACGTPIVSNTLEHFPTDEKRYLGEIPKNENDIVNCIVRVIENGEKYHKCREIARKYYDWKKIIKNSIRTYDELFDDYY